MKKKRIVKYRYEGIKRTRGMDNYKDKLLNLSDEMAQQDLEIELGKYPKRSFDELITCLEEKGIKFNIISKQEAYHILHDLNYYYKLTVYKRNFRKDIGGKCVNLEFAYLVDIASVDMQLRYLLLEATLDIEHALKTLLVASITKNTALDGFDIVRRFFHSTVESSKPLDKDIILEGSKKKSHYQYKLYQAHKNAPPAWVLVEIMGFGDFLRFFEFYFKKYPMSDYKIESLMGSLNGVKRIRNASAHNNAFLFNLADKEIKVNNYIKTYAEQKNIGELFYRCCKIHDVLSVFFVHEHFVKGKGSREHRLGDIKSLTWKSLERFKYLELSNDILYFFKILSKVLDNVPIKE